MNYKLTEEQEILFNNIVEKMQDKIYLALYKTNIAKKDYDEFYSYALEGLLVSFIMLENKVICEEDFEKFSFVTMKRKIIDELRRRNRNKYCFLEDVENLKLFESRECNIEKIVYFNSLKTILTNEEYRILNLIVLGKDYKNIFKELNISKSKGYKLIASLKNKCTTLFYNF